MEALLLLGCHQSAAFCLQEQAKALDVPVNLLFVRRLSQ